MTEPEQALPPIEPLRVEVTDQEPFSFLVVPCLRTEGHEHWMPIPGRAGTVLMWATQIDPSQASTLASLTLAQYEWNQEGVDKAVTAAREALVGPDTCCLATRVNGVNFGLAVWHRFKDDPVVQGQPNWVVAGIEQVLLAYLLREKISDEEFATLTSPWHSAVGVPFPGDTEEPEVEAPQPTSVFAPLPAESVATHED
jgi:hypothetical protein